MRGVLILTHVLKMNAVDRRANTSNAENVKQMLAIGQYFDILKNQEIYSLAA